MIEARRTQLDNLRTLGILDQVISAAEAEGVPPEYLLAIGSRESQLGLALPDSCRGDGGKALTMWQIHEDFHPEFAASHDPCDHVAGAEYAASLLKGHRTWLKSWRLAFAAYNAGQNAVSEAIENGEEVTTVTQGDYMDDVQDRAEDFSVILDEMSAPGDELVTSPTPQQPQTASGWIIGIAAAGLLYTVTRTMTQNEGSQTDE